MDKEMNKLLFALLRCALCGDRLSDEERALYTGERASAVLKTAQKHDVAHLVAHALLENELVSASNAAVQQLILKAVYRYEQINYEFEQICNMLDGKNIAYLPLKGSVIRQYYREPWMRTSCDIDILIHEERVEDAISELERHEYSVGTRYFHDVSLFSPSNVHLELHFNILENMQNIDSVLKDAWNNAAPSDGCRYEFTKEFFLFHVFAHMYYHFVSGGCGIRSLLDIRVIKERWGIDCADIRELLEKAEIYKFAVGISSLADECFSGCSLTDRSQLLLSYIINGGVYGSRDNSVAMNKSENQNMIVYVFKRLFLPYRVMKYEYPSLQKCPIHLPFCYIHRLFAALFGKKRKSAARELERTGDMTDEELANIKTIREYLDI